MSPKYSTGNDSLLHNNELTAKDLQFLRNGIQLHNNEQPAILS
jgi:hypothetical protein